IGNNCTRCDQGFFNSDSLCLRCDCHGNTDPEAPGPECDMETGHCLRCSANTTGTHCERCAKGHVGRPEDRTPESTTAPAPSPAPTTVLAPWTVLPTRPSSSPPVGATSSMPAPPTPEISWVQFNIVVLAVIIAVVVLLTGFVAGVYVYREYRNRKLNAPFWTIELKEDNISFSSYHDSIPNADASGLLEDEASEPVPNGQLSLSAPVNPSYRV
uniref:Laminin EGF-like domain-containing protein n=1 Tax=Callorhinchus milii TaxID=7868 RepID=A0A4W3HKH5_CALMI